MFYNEIEKAYNGLLRNCIKIILGDFNLQVGWETMYRRTIDSDSVHYISNGHGTRLVKFVKDNGHIVNNSFFTRKNINKIT